MKQILTLQLWKLPNCNSRNQDYLLHLVGSAEGSLSFWKMSGRRELRVGDNVSAKVRGWIPYPAVIVDCSLTSKKKSFSVIFYETKETGIIPGAMIWGVSPESIKKYANNTSLRRPYFKSAFEEMMAAEEGKSVVDEEGAKQDEVAHEEMGISMKIVEEEFDEQLQGNSKKEKPKGVLNTGTDADIDEYLVSVDALTNASLLNKSPTESDKHTMSSTSQITSMLDQIISDMRNKKYAEESKMVVDEEGAKQDEVKEMDRSMKLIEEVSDDDFDDDFGSQRVLLLLQWMRCQ